MDEMVPLRGLIAFTGATLLAVASGTLARAQDGDRVRQAQVLTKDAREPGEAGDYDAAPPPLQQAYVLARDPRILADAASAYAAKGACKEARVLYRTYLLVVPEAAEGELGRTIESCGHESQEEAEEAQQEQSDVQSMVLVPDTDT